MKLLKSATPAEKMVAVPGLDALIAKLIARRKTHGGKGVSGRGGGGFRRCILGLGGGGASGSSR